MKRKLKIPRKIFSGILFFALLSGCAGISPVETVKQGQQVTVDYTCFTEDGELIAATRLSEIENPSFKKSNGLIEHDEYKPLVLTAGEAAPGQWDDKLKMMEPEMLTKIALQLPGLEIGTETQILLESEIPEGMKEKNRYRTVKRVSRVPRIRLLNIEQYHKIFGEKLPKPGEILPFYNRPFFKVLEVSSGQLKLEIIAQGFESISPWGTAVTVIEGGMVVTTITAVPGAIVKTGPVIGEITEVTPETITVDYGHPFAGKILKCRVKVLPEHQQPKTKAGMQ